MSETKRIFYYLIENGLIVNRMFSIKSYDIDLQGVNNVPSPYLTFEEIKTNYWALGMFIWPKWAVFDASENFIILPKIGALGVTKQSWIQNPSL